MAGYNTPLALRGITSNEIAKLEEFAKNVPELISAFTIANGIKLSQVQKHNLNKFFLGLSYFQPSEFKFKCGEVKLLSEIASFTSTQITNVNINDNSVNSNIETVVKKSNRLVKTLVGVLFDEDIAECRVRTSKQQICKSRTVFFTPPEKRAAISIESLGQILKNSCQNQAKFHISEHIKENELEQNFLKLRKIDCVNNLNIKFIMDQSVINIIHQQICSGSVTLDKPDKPLESGTNNDDNQIDSNDANQCGDFRPLHNYRFGADLVCYCSQEPNLMTLRVYFRPSVKFVKMVTQNATEDTVSKNIQKCWLMQTLKRHLFCHKKNYEQEQEPPVDAVDADDSEDTMQENRAITPFKGKIIEIGNPIEIRLLSYSPRGE